MSQSHSTPLDVADAAFHLVATGPPPLVLDGTALGHGLPARPISLIELKAILLASATAYAARDVAVAELLRLSRSGDERWTVGLTGVLLPGLRRMAARLTRRYPGDSDCIDAEVLAGFLEAVGTGAGRGRTGVAATLLWAGYRRGRDLWIQEVTASVRRAPGVIPVMATRAANHPDLVLARAVEVGVITAEEAELIGSTRLERVRVRDLAARKGVAVGALRRRRERAEARLVAYLRSGDAHVSRFARNRRLVLCGLPGEERPDAAARRTADIPASAPHMTAKGGDNAPCRPEATDPGSRAASHPTQGDLPYVASALSS